MINVSKEYPKLAVKWGSMKTQKKGDKFGKKQTIEWKTLKEFAEWSLENGYQECYYLRRKDLNVGFTRENCYWTPDKGVSEYISKGVDREEFETALDLYIRHKLKQTEAAAYCGLSDESFRLRTKQFLAPEVYGELPKGFFLGRSQTRTKQGKPELREKVKHIIQNDEDLKLEQMDTMGFIFPEYLKRFDIDESDT